MAYQYAVKHNVNFPSGWEEYGKAIKDWFYGFMKRHTILSLRKPAPLSIFRAKGFSTNLFANLMSVYDNIDETGFPTVPPKPGKVIAEKGSRVGKAAGAERGTNVSMCIGVSASGQSIPPFFLFPRKNWKSMYMDNATPGAVGFANDSGYMTRPNFIEFFEHFIKHTYASKDDPILLIMDNHSSHLSVDVIDLAKENGITIVTLPPHCSHRMQPLDQGVFGPVKHYYEDECDLWSKANAGRSIELHHVVCLVDKAMRRGLTQSNIRNSFERTGICPLNRSKFTEDQFVAAKVTGENERAIAELQGLPEDEKPSLLVVFDNENDALGASEEVSTSEVSTPYTSKPSTPSLSSLRESLAEIGPVQFVPARKKSNRGPKGMKSVVLTIPEKRAELQEKAERRAANAAKKAQTPAPPTKKANASATATATKRAKAPATKINEDSPGGKQPAKRKKVAVKNKTANKKQKDSTSSEEEERDLANICLECDGDLDFPMTRNNTIRCFVCQKAYHLRCVAFKSCFVCKNCDSDEDLSDED